MDRGIYKYVCKDCGHEFFGVDMELNCTAESAPVKCPKCGSFNTYSSGPLLFYMCKEVAKTEHSHPLGMVVSTHFRCGKGVKRGLKNGALPFNID